MDLSSLNPPQREATKHDQGPLLVLAGAGSGKTRVITHRIGLLLERGVRPGAILGLTFTNKAATEMRERLASLMNRDLAKQVRLHTFHALGANILRDEIEAIGYKRPFTILDEAERERVLKRVLEELKLSSSAVPVDRILGLISQAKNAMTTPAKLSAAKFSPEMPRAQQLFGHYQQALKNLNAVDFDDLLLMPTELFRNRPDIREKYRQMFRYILVDEYQDTNPIQLAFLAELVAPPQLNLMVVGDDDQSIYGFRGAASDTILLFEKIYPTAKVITLEQNYRSVSNILRVANQVIGRNTKRKVKNLWSAHGDGALVQHVALSGDDEEAKWIANRIGSQQASERRSLDEFAILFRAGNQARELEEALRARRLPYRLVGAQSLFDRKEIKDALCYLRLLLNPHDELALRRVINVPSRGIGITTMANIDQTAKEEGIALFEVVRRMSKQGKVAEKTRTGMLELTGVIDATRQRLREVDREALRPMLLNYLTEIGVERAIRADEPNPNVAEIRWKMVSELVEGIARADEPESASAYAVLDRYVQSVTLDLTLIAQEREEENRNKITLMTLHSSKGLEFPVVFMCGMSEELLPHRRAVEEGGGAAIAEERRLCYVGITRAREQLVLTRSRSANLRGERVTRKASRFLGEIPPELLEMLDASGGPTMPVAPDPTKLSNLEQIAKLQAMLQAKQRP